LIKSKKAIVKKKAAEDAETLEAYRNRELTLWAG